MGFFDKAKSFLGGHGLKVEITRVERQAPSEVSFPLGDSVLKGNYRISAEKDCVVLSHAHEFIVMKKHADGREEKVTLGRSVHDHKTDIIGGSIKWPYELGAGKSAEDGFLISDIDIGGTLAKLGYPDAAGALQSPELKFYLKVEADVKGSPFDPNQEVPIRIVG